MKWTPDPGHMLCRDLLHAWRPHTARRVGKGYERTLECERCGTLKVQRLTRTGLIANSGMRYPKGYLAPKGHGVFSKDERARLRKLNLQKMGEEEA